MASSRVSEAVSAPEPPFEGVGTATGGHYTGPRLTASPLKRLSARASASAAPQPRRASTSPSRFGFLGTLFAARAARPRRLRPARRRGGRHGLLPEPPRPHRRGGAREVRLRLRDRGVAGGGCAACSGRRLLVKAAGGLAAGIVLVAHRAGRRLDLRRHRPHRPVSRGGGAARSLQSPEGVASAALILRERYDVRAWLLASSMGLRMTGLAVGAHFGVTEAVVGHRRRPGGGDRAAGRDRARRVSPLSRRRAGAARRGPPRHSPLRLPLQPCHGRRLAARRARAAAARRRLQAGAGRVLPHRPGAATGARVAQRAGAPDHAHRADARLGARRDRSGLRRRSPLRVLGRAADGAASCRPPTSSCPGSCASCTARTTRAASDAARLVLLAAALQFVFGWSKSLPVSIGRPGLRVIAHGIESVVMIPLVVVLGPRVGGYRRRRGRPCFHGRSSA